MTSLEAFLSGDQPDDVAIFLADEHLKNANALAEYAEQVDGGYVLVLDGERGRRVFPAVAGDSPMEFAQAATERAGTVGRDLSSGSCPEEGEDDDHGVRFVLAFAQERTEGAGGRYEAGDVIHAYARCSCGAAYSDRWIVGT